MTCHLQACRISITFVKDSLSLIRHLSFIQKITHDSEMLFQIWIFIIKYEEIKKIVEIAKEETIFFSQR